LPPSPPDGKQTKNAAVAVNKGPIQTNKKKFPSFKMKYMGPSDTESQRPLSDDAEKFVEEEIGQGDECMPE
jgi:hypothetical protein